jgi:hypothetical protein
MNRAIAIGFALLLAAGVAWGVWRFVLTSPAMDSSAVIETAGGRAYQFIAAPNIGWDDARAAAAKLSWHGHPGYLATVDSPAEYQLILDRVFSRTYPDVTYLGGRQTAPGEWRWVTGPDGRFDNGKGRLFWRGDETGAMQPGSYANWMATAFQHGGKWDISKVCCVSLFSYGLPQFSTSLGNGDADEHVSGYLVEFGS